MDVYVKFIEGQEWLATFSYDRQSGEISRGYNKFARTAEDSFDEIDSVTPSAVEDEIQKVMPEVHALLRKGNEEYLTSKRKNGAKAVKSTDLTIHGSSLSLVIHAAPIFKNPSFLEWLNDGKPKMTWHQGGAPSDFSDVIVCVDPSLSGEGTDTDMPEEIWQAIVQKVIDFGVKPSQYDSHITVRLVNI